MRPTLLFLAAVLAVCGCTRLSDRGFDRTKFVTDAEKLTVVRLVDYTAFEWDQVHIFAPYTPSKAIKDEVGRSVPFPHSDSEDHCLLVFLSKGKITAAFEIERKPADFAQLYRKGGYSREEAIFFMEIRSADQWRYLRKRQANQSLQPTAPSGRG